VHRVSSLLVDAPYWVQQPLPQKKSGGGLDVSAVIGEETRRAIHYLSCPNTLLRDRVTLGRRYSLLSERESWSKSRHEETNYRVVSKIDSLWGLGMPKYWVAGAMWDGKEDQYRSFIQGGFWELGWAEDEQPIQQKRRDAMQTGDRIAIKKMSVGRRTIEIRALGVVTAVDSRNNHIHVDWLMKDLDHSVESRGCWASIHGPFSCDDEWTQRVFLLKQFDHLLGADRLPDIDESRPLAKEGTRSWRVHLMIERSRKNVERKKAQVMRKKGSLDCEACGFSFAKFYGIEFCEVHHRLPLSQVLRAKAIKLDDLAILCSNCHRMIHMTKPTMSVEDFAKTFKADRKSFERQMEPDSGHGASSEDPP
jgi:5-methylcytosine-specific restriction endonuclease McrA